MGERDDLPTGIALIILALIIAAIGIAYLYQMSTSTTP